MDIQKDQILMRRLLILVFCLVFTRILFGQQANIQKPIDGNIYVTGNGSGLKPSSTGKILFQANSSGFNGSVQAYHKIYLNGNFLKQITDFPNGIVKDSVELDPGNNFFDLEVQSTLCFNTSCIVTSSNQANVVYVKELNHSDVSIQNSGVGAIKVKWNKHNNSGTTNFHYQLYRNTQNDPTTAIPISAWTQQSEFIDLPNVNNSNHYYWVKVANDNLGSFTSSLGQAQSTFVDSINPSMNVNSPSNYEYWFNEEYSTKTHGNLNGNTFQANIDASTLQNGLHAYHIRFKDAFGIWSCVQSDFFIKEGASSFTTNGLITYESWFNQDFAIRNLDSAYGVKEAIITTLIDASNLDFGLNSIHLRFKDLNQGWSVVQSQYFLKERRFNPFLIEKEYWWDEDYQNKQTTNLIAVKQTYISTALATGSLINGLHSFHTRTMDTDSNWSVIQSQYFLKQEGNLVKRIDSLRYWFDEDSLFINENVISASAFYDWQNNLSLPVNLDSGIHFLHVQFRDDLGDWSVALTDTFLLEKLNVSVQLLYPDSGIFDIGDSIHIRFSSNGQHHYGLYLWEDTLTELGTIFHDGNSNADTSFVWVIPDSIRFDSVSPYYTISGSNYRIKAVVWPSNISGTDGAFDFSDFKIELYKIRKINGVRMRELKRVNLTHRKEFSKINNTIH